MADLVAEQARRLSTHLVDYLTDVTRNAQKNPVRDVLSTTEKAAPQMVLWVDDLPPGLRPSGKSRAARTIVSVAPPAVRPAPQVPAGLQDWLDSAAPWDATSPTPRLLAQGPVRAQQSIETPLQPPSDEIRRRYALWLDNWKAWQLEAIMASRVQKIYDQLEKAFKEATQNDDAMELVLAVGLVVWSGPDGRRIRRHLMTEEVAITTDKATARIDVTLASSRRRLEDQELFRGLVEIYHPERASEARRDLQYGETLLPLNPDQLEPLLQWAGTVLSLQFQRNDQAPYESLPTPTAVVGFAPALVLRPRSRALLSEAYSSIAQKLRESDVTVPVSMAQLVTETEPADRSRWLEHDGAVRGEVLGNDPLFPLASNDEQRRVMSLMRTETGIVVQGPPGTGKTHTIANLVCALLARGQRVLVTSQKEQALRVLREKIPAELRALCVMLAGGSGNGAQELERGLSAFSAAVGNSDPGRLPAEVSRLRDERARLQSRSAELNNQIQRLRDSELEVHHAVVPGFSRTEYSGRLAAIVAQVVRETERYGWFPAATAEMLDSPPLGEADLLELRRMLCQDESEREQRSREWLPELKRVPTVAEFEALVRAHQEALNQVAEEGTEHPRLPELQRLPREVMRDLAVTAHQFRGVLHRIDPQAYEREQIRVAWVLAAVEDHLTGRRGGLWAAVRAEQGRAQELLSAFQGLDVVDLEIEGLSLGQSRGMLERGRELVAFLQKGGRLRRLAPAKAQTNAAEFLRRVKVNGTSPTTVETAQAAVSALDVQITTGQLVELWRDAGVALEAPTHRTREALSELVDKSVALAAVEELAAVAREIESAFRRAQKVIDVSSLATLIQTCAAAKPALALLRREEAGARLDSLAVTVTAEADGAVLAEETQQLVKAIRAYDGAAYFRAIKALGHAHVQREQILRFEQLRRRLREVHPSLLDLLENDPTDPEWDERLSDLPHAWAWRKAWFFVAKSRSLVQEQELSAEHRQVEDRLSRRTAEQAAAEAELACLKRMSDAHVRALRTYQEHIGHAGAGMGKRSKTFQRVARQALEEAKDAVPAWVVPLPKLLENLPAERNSFDVVIVDEASQVGMENLFLLWLAPRIIVVGDDKQCTPGDNRLGKQEVIQGFMDQHLGELSPVIRENFTEKSNLYGVMSARSGLASVVSLKEHFRCVPEIVNWSSSQFYGSASAPGLIPLRERKAGSLEPLRVTTISNGYTEGLGTKRRNPAEAEAIVEQLADCIDAPEYKGKTFGIIALQGSHQILLLEDYANKILTPEQRQRVELRIGNAANFQGDERDVIFLSMVADSRPRAVRATMYRQAFNVAATRARDQMWLFSSIEPTDLVSDDLRYSLYQYMLEPPSVFGESPALEDVSESEPCQPFDSLFEQRVFRKIRERGFHVVPQYPVGARRLDLVVVGENGRLAVECDGTYFHASPVQRENDARRDRELHRMGWSVERVRESEFTFDPDQALRQVWVALEQRGIHPLSMAGTVASEWSPIELGDDDLADDENDDRQGTS